MSARIVLVEDHPDNMELMAYLLKAAGYTYCCAGDGAQGLELIRRGRPDLVVCDLQMPVLDGFQVLQQLRDDASLRQTPIVAVTALSMPADRERVLRAGFDGYFSKPIEPENFVRQLEAWIPADKRARRP
jgi:two-component system, cell cycle response regulator DivK